MTKKDYELIASGFNEAYKNDYKNSKTILDTALIVASYLLVDNPRFDTHKFMQACIIKA